MLHNQQTVPYRFKIFSLPEKQISNFIDCLIDWVSNDLGAQMIPVVENQRLIT